MSINFGLGANGKYLCELSSSDHELHPQDLKHRPGFIYGPTLVRYNYLYINRRKQFLCVCPSFFDGVDGKSGVVLTVVTGMSGYTLPFLKGY